MIASCLLSLSLRVSIFTVATPRSSYWIIAAGEQDPLALQSHLVPAEAIPGRGGQEISVQKTGK